jgi:hypothetical protein
VGWTPRKGVNQMPSIRADASLYPTDLLSNTLHLKRACQTCHVTFPIKKSDETMLSIFKVAYSLVLLLWLAEFCLSESLTLSLSDIIHF